ncbi:F0F1 ATP synthase subunit B [Pseudonocardia endophytica]|uniref:ATP synthase subunit b n=1 Tax=Pseudonocardia endophytica TaxID=401976 RepID=A0A4R1HTH7_PSEEN|nr:F0F1 ATP synthase subunit B [Pseudonocardia endophytica]TCK20722.1 ATP synthase F0 subunit b [Pseudonocardia endophytica]
MATFIAELVGFVVVLFVLYRYVWPILKRMMDDRQEQIRRQVVEADEAEKALAEAERRHDNAVAEAEQESSRIRDDARADASRIREEMAEQTEQEIARIKQRGEEQLVAERDASVRKLRAETGTLSMDLAKRIIAESLSDEDQKRASVDGFLDDLDALGGSGSGTRQPAQTGGGVS